jgi:hypothetical protein
MPFDAGPSMPIPDPQLEGLAADTDRALGEALSAVVPAPMKPYNAKVVNSLGEALADVLALFDMSVEAEKYSGPVEALDPDMVRFLGMVSAAAEDFGKPVPIRLEEIRDEAALTRITAALRDLAADEDFREFLNGEAEAEPMTETEVAVEVTAPPVAVEEEFDFAGRMRR